jgi:hypothetical protein
VVQICNSSTWEGEVEELGREGERRREERRLHKIAKGVKGTHTQKALKPCFYPAKDAGTTGQTRLETL